MTASPYLAIDHVQLGMPPGGEGRARSFYEGILGLAEVPKPEPMRASGGVWFRSGGVEVHLGVDPDPRPSGRAHPALLVADVLVIATRCEAAGVPVRWDERYPGVRRFYLVDPFGNRIEIMQRG
jgi:catechol 2,3-dioxygenase-like lactoylglutathione lyase family enzyme